ncbi:MAG: DUF167 domain-containing protein [bacterium]|nr:DUF167 domain-containing protein [bacterium]
MDAPFVQESAEGTTLQVRVQANASRDELAGVFDGRLRIRLISPPVEGAANTACIRFLSKRLGIAKTRITILRGAHTRNKVIGIGGMKAEGVKKKLLACQ